MAEKKSILEEALLDIKNIQGALNANTKEILRSVAKEEIDSVVKESLLKEVGYEEEDLESPEGETELGGDADAATSGLEVPAMGGEESDDDGLGDIEGSEEVGLEPEMGMEPELGMDSDELGTEPMDMTAASDDDVIAIYKKLSGEDEIEIVGDEIHMNISEPGQYIVKAGNSPVGGASTEAPMDLDSEMGDEEMGGDDMGVDYEIEMGDEEGGEAPADLEPVDDEEGEGEEIEGGEEEEEEEVEQLDEKIAIGTGMSVGNNRNPRTGGSIGAAENPKSVNESARLVSETTKKYNNLLTEARKLKSENEQFRGALKEFRNKLVETVVFNSNLTYVTRLFMEHSTTKGEKQSIIKRFDDEVSNLKESKKLYKTIATQLENRKPISESVENKIIKEATTSSSKQLNESTAYVDPSTKRILDLINRVEKK
jgi:hypothetical protein